jgi:hypothetical protein
MTGEAAPEITQHTYAVVTGKPGAGTVISRSTSELGRAVPRARDPNNLTCAAGMVAAIPEATALMPGSIWAFPIFVDSCLDNLLANNTAFWERLSYSIGLR